jgi:hypothetical protein
MKTYFSPSAGLLSSHRCLPPYLICVVMLKPKDYIDGDECVRKKIVSAALGNREVVYVSDGLDTAEFERVQESPGDAAPRSSLRPSRGRVTIHKRSNT